jgi:hypothetical protein
LLSVVCFIAVPARASEGALSVDVDVGSSGLSAEAIRQAIARELGIAVTSRTTEAHAAGMRITIDPARRAVVAYRGPGAAAQSIERAVELPKRADRATEMLAFLAGNLARDEAGELLDRLRAAPSSSDAAPPSAANPVSAETAAASQLAMPAPEHAPAEQPATPSNAVPPDGLRPTAIDLTFVHPIGVYSDSDQRRFAVALGLAYSRVGAVGGFAFNPFALRIEKDVDGFSGSFFWHSVGRDTRGVSMSGIASWAGGSLSGFDGAMVLLWREGKTEGVSMSGVVNVSTGDVDGFQGATALNVARDVDGVQIGIVNIGRRIRGTQIGIVNVADEVKGLPIGLVNVVRKGRTQAVAWSSVATPINAGVKYLFEPLYSMVTFGVSPQTSTASKYEPGFGLGARLPLSRVFVEADVLYTVERQFNRSPDIADVLHYRAMGGIELGSAFALFGGLTLRHEIPRGTENAHLGLDYVAGIQLF